MIWAALQALALSHDRRVSWRDLAQHAVEVPGHVQAEIAVSSLCEHGLQARAFQTQDAVKDLSSIRLPVALRLSGGPTWVLLTALESKGAQVTTFEWMPNQQEVKPHSEHWTLDKLNTLHDGLCIDISVAAPDKQGSRASWQEDASASTSQHDWFWDVFSRLRAHYGDCVLAAVLVNVLTLAGSMFSMNVYDRIIPNAAMHSMWTLAIGVILAAVIELGLRSLRAHVLDDAGKRADVALSASLLKKTLNLRPADRPVSSGQWASQLREFDSVRRLCQFNHLGHPDGFAFCSFVSGRHRLDGWAFGLGPAGGCPVDCVGGRFDPVAHSSIGSTVPI